MRIRHSTGMGLGAAPGDPTRANAPLENNAAIERCDRRSDWEVIARLPELARPEPSTVEVGERAHLRVVVLNELRYLRRDESPAGYDPLTRAQGRAALEQPDLTTIDKSCGHERKPRRREPVLIAVEHVRGQLWRAGTEKPRSDDRSVQ